MNRRDLLAAAGGAAVALCGLPVVSAEPDEPQLRDVIVGRDASGHYGEKGHVLILADRIEYHLPGEGQVTWTWFATALRPLYENTACGADAVLESLRRNAEAEQFRLQARANG